MNPSIIELNVFENISIMNSTFVLHLYITGYNYNWCICLWANTVYIPEWFTGKWGKVAKSGKK